MSGDRTYVGPGDTEDDGMMDEELNHPVIFGSDLQQPEGGLSSTLQVPRSMALLDTRAEGCGGVSDAHTLPLPVSGMGTFRLEYNPAHTFGTPNVKEYSTPVNSRIDVDPVVIDRREDVA